MSGGGGGGGAGTLVLLTLRCHHLNDSALRSASTRDIFFINVSFIVRDNVHKTQCSSSVLLHVHGDRKDYQGRLAQQDGHLDFHTAPVGLSGHAVSKTNRIF